MKMRRILSLLLMLSVLIGMFSLFACDMSDIDTDLPLGEFQKPTERPTQKPTENLTEEPTQSPSENSTEAPTQKPVEDPSEDSITLENIPEFDGESPFVIINDNKPFFTEDDYTTDAYEEYAPLDSLGRCGVTMACVGKEIMPTEDRGSISSVKPTGWVQNKYSTSIVDGGYLYNRAHLIGFQLTGENANKNNLITGTRYFNVTGMLPFENMVADHIRENGGHVLYRVTPIFEGDNLLASGVLMEAYSVEDGGDAIEFCVFVYNVQPGIYIDYETGDNKLAE